MSGREYDDGDREWLAGRPTVWPKPPLGSRPGWVDVQPWVHDEAHRENDRRDRIAALPRVRFLWFEPDFNYDRGERMTGFMWDKHNDAEEGELVYRRQFLICTAFRFLIER